MDLIYLDPPFNTGKQWNNPIGEGGGNVGFNDIWGWDRVTGETLEETIARQWEEERRLRGYGGTRDSGRLRWRHIARRWGATARGWPPA